MKAPDGVRFTPWSPDNMDPRTLLGLVGLKVDRAAEHEGSIYLVISDGRVAALVPEGECCAYTYVQHVNNPECLAGSVVVSVEDLVLTDEQRAALAVVEEHADKEVVDIWGHRINTTSGTCVLDCRTEHNGYYGGSLDLGWADALPDGAKPLEDR